MLLPEGMAWEWGEALGGKALGVEIKELSPRGLQKGAVAHWTPQTQWVPTLYSRAGGHPALSPRALGRR